jgi:hypothetical protein
MGHLVVESERYYYYYYYTITIITSAFVTVGDWQTIF